jgi:hypothetical protein
MIGDWQVWAARYTRYGLNFVVGSGGAHAPLLPDLQTGMPNFLGLVSHVVLNAGAREHHDPDWQHVNGGDKMCQIAA